MSFKKNFLMPEEELEAFKAFTLGSLTLEIRTEDCKIGLANNENFILEQAYCILTESKSIIDTPNTVTAT